MVIVKATALSETGVMPSVELLQTMGAFNQQMIEAGVLVDGGGLKPTAQGARVRFEGDSRTVIDGPFSLTSDLMAGYWILQAGSLQEITDWIKRCPPPHAEPTEIEIRPLYEMEDFETLPVA